MPLTALVDGTAVNTIELPGGDWQEIYATRRRQLEILCPGCRGVMHAKELGPLHFFAHNPGEARPDCAHSNESLAHMGLKGVIAEAAKTAGATIEIEVPFDGGQVDVLATTDTGKTWALEAQLSPLNTADAITRDRRYRNEYGNTAWVHTLERQWRHRIPALQIDDPDTATIIAGVYRDSGDTPLAPHPLTDAIPNLLTGRYMWVFEESRIQGRSYGFWIDNQTAGRSAADRARIVAAQRAGAHPKHSDGGNDVCSRTGLDLTGAVGNNIDSGPCRWCHRPSYLADGGGWVHPCCEDWQGPDCPACRTSTGHATARHDRGGRTKGRK